MKPSVQQLGDIYLLDSQHMGNEGTVAVYLLPCEDGFALIETGPASCLNTLKVTLQHLGFDLAELKHILVTHIHLDHAGAAGALAEATGAKVYVHANGAAHLHDPSKLMASASRIYGELMDSLWGKMTPIPRSRLEPLAGGETLRLSGLHIEVVDTPGHAYHHLAYLVNGEALFTGDAAGIHFAGSPVIRPALPPPEVDLEAWQDSIEHMLALKPQRLLLTHFGEVQDAETHLRQVPERNQRWAESILEGLRAGESDEVLLERLKRLGDAELLANHTAKDIMRRHQLTSNYQMTVMGLKRYWQKQHPEKLTLS